MLSWMRFRWISCYQVPSPIGIGDVIDYVYDKETSDAIGEEEGTVHQMKILRMWISFDHGKFTTMATVKEGSSGEGTSALSTLLDRKYVICVNGKDSIPTWYR